MADNLVKFRHGSYAAYLAAKDAGRLEESTLYFITDEGNARLYKGDKLFTQQWEVRNGLPAVDTAKPDRLYLDLLNNKISYFDATQNKFVDVLEGGKVTVADAVTETGTDPVSSKAVFSFVKEEIKAIADIEVDFEGLVSDISAGETAGTLVVTKGKESNTVTVKGAVISPVWDSTTRKLTLNNTTEEAIVVDLGKDMVITSGRYDADNKDLILVIGEDESNTVTIPVDDLVATYTASADHSGAVKITVASNEIKGQILVDGASILSVVDGALTADLSGYVTTGDFDTLEKAVEDLAADVDAISKKVEKNIVDIGLINDFITNDLNTRIDERLKDTTDEIKNINTALSNLETNFKAADATLLADAKSYTDGKVAEAVSTWTMIGA